MGRLYDEYGASLSRYAVMLLADPAAAEDAVHQVFTALLRGNADVEHAEHYLRRAVRNECYSMLRRWRGGAAANDRPLLELVDDAVIDQDERLALEEAIRRLPPEQREVIHLHVFEGRTFKEIAAATETSINTIAARYRYAIEKLRQA